MSKLKPVGSGVSTTKFKHNYKITPNILHEIINLINGGVTNEKILSIIDNKFSVSITSSRISQIKNRLRVTQLDYYNKDLEKKLIVKMNITDNMLDIIADSYTVIRKYIKDIRANGTQLTNRDITLINNVVATTHRLYTDLVGDMDNKQTIDNNIQNELR